MQYHPDFLTSDDHRNISINYTEPNTQQTRLNKVSYFPIKKRMFLFFSLIALVSFLTLITISISDLIIYDTNVTIISRMIIFLFGPLLAFFFYLSLVLYLFHEETFRPSFKVIFEYGLIGGLAAILISITINTRSFLLMIGLLPFVGIQSSVFIVTAVLVPLVEETAKGLPIYYLTKGLITRPNDDTEYRVFQNIRSPVFIGTLTGAIFNLLETYWYIWNLGYLFSLDDNQIWGIIFNQVVIRAFNPLHLLTASVIGLGLGLSLWNSPRKVLAVEDYRPALMGFIIALAFHGSWNGSLVLSEGLPIISIFGIELPPANFLLLLISLIGLFSLWRYMSSVDSSFCTYCKEWHAPPFSIDVHYDIPNIRIPFFIKIMKIMRREKFANNCPTCKSRIRSGFCQICQSTKLFTCGNCNAPIPAHSSQCWSCKKITEVPFSNIMNYPKSTNSKLVRPILYIFTGFYIFAALSLTLSISFALNNTNLNDIPDLDKILILNNFLLFLGILSFRIFRLLNNPIKYAMGYSLANTLFAMLVVQFAIYFLFIGLMFIGLSGFVGSIGFIFTGILFIIEAVIIFIYGMSIINDFSPLFHEVAIERKEVNR